MSANNNRLLPLSIAALGVVYGDIGTSPLYALRESLRGLAITQVSVLGALSLIFWTLILVISTRYLSIILRADNDGEGGVLALLALIKKHSKSNKWFFFLGILGAGLLLGDGMLTPAISVLSAVEGVERVSPAFVDYVVPATLCILLGLFMSQRFGTAKIGVTFGPIICCWFLMLGALGAVRIFQNPAVLKAVNPYYAFQFFWQIGWPAYALLGGVFLVITGAEAMYADLGHFGKTPIRTAWYCVALPGLLLNYFGQGAYLLQNHSAIDNPFFAMAPDWVFYPLLVLATLATIIASQAIITATFSLVKQSVLLELLPRISIVQTSGEAKGQVYVPRVNVVLAIGTTMLILWFKSSAALAGAYGLAVNVEMIVVALLVMVVARRNWGWSIPKVIHVFFVFVVIDFAFFGANLHKFFDGGWVPMLFAIVVATVMSTWHSGMQALRAMFYKTKVPLAELHNGFDSKSLLRVPQFIAIFVTDPYDQSGGGLLHYLKLNRILPEQVLVVSITVESSPIVSLEQRYEVTKLVDNVHHLTLHIGFMESPNIPDDLLRANESKRLPFHLDPNQVAYFVEIPSLTATRREKMLLFYWQERLFAFLMHNSVLDVEFFKLPYNRTISIGTYCEI